MAEPGDIVKIVTEKEELEGVLLPSSRFDSDVVIIKLKNGYNLAIRKENVRKIDVLEHYQKKKAKREAYREKPGKPTIAILHTGGTITSKVDYRTGGVIAGFTAEEMLDIVPEIKDIANIRSRGITKMQSEMMRFSYYNIIAEEIRKEVEQGVDGVIVSHGTDTMHYTSAALSFMLEDLPVPVILVGAQRSSDRGSTDSRLNLLNAAYFIANSDFAGVAICMHAGMSDELHYILPGLKCRKMHTSRRDAFRAVNSVPIAQVDFLAKKIEIIAKEYPKKDSGRKLKLHLMKPDIKVGIIKTHTNMYAEQFAAYRGWHGLVLEGTGLGHIPNEKIDEHSAEHEKIQKTVAELVKSGTVVVIASQTIYGRVLMNVYSPQRELLEIGVIGDGNDMTPETSFIKLAWLLSNYPKSKAKELFMQNLKGELSERTEAEMFLN